MTTQEMCDFLAAKLEEYPELADRDVIRWPELSSEFEVADARVMYKNPDGTVWSGEQFQDSIVWMEIA